MKRNIPRSEDFEICFCLIVSEREKKMRRKHRQGLRETVSNSALLKVKLLHKRGNVHTSSTDSKSENTKEVGRGGDSPILVEIFQKQLRV